MGMMRKHGKHRLHMKTDAARSANQACQKHAWREHYGKCPTEPHPRSYPDRNLARKALHAGQERGEPYRCYCGSYHVQTLSPSIAAAVALLVESLREDHAPVP